MAPNDRTVWQSAAAVAAALFVAAIALGAPDNSHAQNLPQDHRAQKKTPPKGSIQPLRKGPLAVGPNRIVPPHRPALAPGATPQGRDPRLTTFNKGQTNARFGNQPGSRALGNQFGRGFTHRDPRLRAVNARTP